MAFIQPRRQGLLWSSLLKLWWSREKAKNTMFGDSHSRRDRPENGSQSAE